MLSYHRGLRGQKIAQTLANGRRQNCNFRQFVIVEKKEEVCNYTFLPLHPTSVLPGQPRQTFWIHCLKTNSSGPIRCAFIMLCLKDDFWAQEFLARWVVVWRSCVQSRSQYQLQGNARARHIRHLGISPDERLVTRKKLGGKWDLRALLVPQTSLPPFFAFQPPGCSYLCKGLACILTRFSST